MEVVNPPPQSQEHVASNDKDFPSVIDTLIEIHTLLTLQQCKLFEDTKNP